jgi:predicted O-methyltransferase YrrM
MSLLRWLRHLLVDWRDRARLFALPTATCEVTALRGSDASWITKALEDQAVAAEWPAVEREIGAMEITTSAGGVNLGDRRAIYHLVRALRPAQVLEVGTHIGASTVHIAAALRANGANTSELTTVDLMAVNDAATRPWVHYGARFAPIELVTKLGMEKRVRFVTSPSITFLAQEGPRYDLIFLDGDHTPATVYLELPAALKRLNPGGVILLHDYYPNGQPLWSNGVIIVGPWLATERLRREGAKLQVLPLGALPWPTKLGSNVTSLAIAARA